MTNYSLLSDHELHEKTLQSAAQEKSATLRLLEHLAEVDSRMLHARRGFSSLWEYVHLALGYSESQASERVSAMRLMRKIPEVKSAVEQGSMTLTSTLKLATFVKREKVNMEATIELLKECEGKSTRQVEKILIAKAERPEMLPFSLHAERVDRVSDCLSKVQFTADEEFLSLMERAKQITSRSLVSGAEMKEVLKIALKEFVQKHEPKAHTDKKNQEQKQKTPVSLRAAEVVRENPSRYIPSGLKTQVRIRSKDQCEFVDGLTGRRCGQKRFLEFDHKIPFAKGGRHSLENLRHYCRTHNAFHAVQTYGRKKMEQFRWT